MIYGKDGCCGYKIGWRRSADDFDIDMTKRVLRNTRKRPIWYYTKDNDNDFTPPVYIWGVR